MLTTYANECDTMSTSCLDKPYDQISRSSYRSDLLPRSSTPSMIPVSRKRPRLGSSHHYSNHGISHTAGLDQAASASSFDCASPTPLVNTDYVLFGGMDTPGAWNCQREEGAGLYDAEQDYRLNRFASRPSDTSQPQVDTPSSSRSLSGWHLRRAAWAVTGGLAGKIFNFCWNTTFRGFSAGEGQTYPADTSPQSAQHGPNDNSDNFLKKRYSKGIPGSYPRNSLPTGVSGPTSPNYNDQPPDNSATKNNWVFVERNNTLAADGSPVRKRSKASIAGSGSARQNTSHPIDTYRTHHTASYASPRSRATSSALPHSRIYSTNGPTSLSSKRQKTSLLAASPSRRHVSLYQPPSQPQSPISPEVQAYKRQKRRETKKQDESLRRLNAQLQGMIREGQQALSSKIEVIESSTSGHDRDYDHDYDTDEGYFDDDLR